RYRWPGNVRELQNVVERAVLLGKGDLIMVDDLPGTLAAEQPSIPVAAGRRTLREALAEPERRIIREVLEANGWNRSITADALGIHRPTPNKKRERLGLDPQLVHRARRGQSVLPPSRATRKQAKRAASSRSGCGSKRSAAAKLALPRSGPG